MNASLPGNSAPWPALLGNTLCRPNTSRWTGGRRPHSQCKHEDSGHVGLHKQRRWCVWALCMFWYAKVTSPLEKMSTGPIQVMVKHGLLKTAASATMSAAAARVLV